MVGDGAESTSEMADKLMPAGRAPLTKGLAVRLSHYRRRQGARRRYCKLRTGLVRRGQHCGGKQRNGDQNRATDSVHANPSGATPCTYLAGCASRGSHSALAFSSDPRRSSTWTTVENLVVFQQS